MRNERPTIGSTFVEVAEYLQSPYRLDAAASSSGHLGSLASASTSSRIAEVRSFAETANEPSWRCDVSGRLVVRLFVVIVLTGLASRATAQTLEGFAKLSADTFAPGPTSGNLIAPANGRVPPFDGQPVQGISSVLPGPRGDFYVMPDNGFGTKESSPDFVLRVYRIDPHFKTKHGGSGAIDVESFITLHDPDRKIDFPIVADGSTYPGSAIPVDARIHQERLLTGGDFDIESVRVAYDGTLWFGDEFGPFLVHTDARGKVLEAPVPLPGVKSPQNPFLGGSTPNLPRSKGFEGRAESCNGTTLYPMLEGPLTTDADQHRLKINEFKVKTGSYTGRQWFYRLEAASSTGQSIGDLTRVGKTTFLVIERDNFEGPAAFFKKIFVVDLDDVDAAGFLVKHEVADLLNIKDPSNLGGFGACLPLPVPDDRERDRARPSASWRPQRQQLPLQRRSGGGAVRSRRVHRHPPGSPAAQHQLPRRGSRRSTWAQRRAPLSQNSRVLRRQDRRHRRTRRWVLDQRGHGLALVRSERRDVDESSDLRIVAGFRDHDAPVRVANENRGSALRGQRGGRRADAAESSEGHSPGRNQSRAGFGPSRALWTPAASRQR